MHEQSLQGDGSGHLQHQILLLHRIHFDSGTRGRREHDHEGMHGVCIMQITIIILEYGIALHECAHPDLRRLE